MDSRLYENLKGEVKHKELRPIDIDNYLLWDRYLHIDGRSQILY